MFRVGLRVLRPSRPKGHFSQDEGGVRHAPPQRKKTEVTERPEAFHHVGSLVSGPPGRAGLLFT